MNLEAGMDHLNNNAKSTEDNLSFNDLPDQDRLAMVLRAIDSAIIISDCNGNIIQCNEACSELVDLEEDFLTGQRYDLVISLWDRQTDAKLPNLAESTCICKQKATFSDGVELRLPGRTSIPVTVTVSPICGFQQIIGVVISIRDITEEINRQSAIRFLSYHDQLTGLYNRHFFEAEKHRLDKKRNWPLSLIMADVNGLKLINDAYGHAAGDTLLKKTAMVISESCRSDDIIARLGGDEFVVLLPQTSLDETSNIVNRIRLSCKEQIIESEPLSLALGWSCKTEEIQSFDEIMRLAEDRMYRAKLLENANLKNSRLQRILDTLYDTHPSEKGHANRVKNLSLMIGKALQLHTQALNDLETICMLHDIGKIAVAQSILNKTDSLTSKDWEEIRRHPEVGYRIMNSVNELAELADPVLAHHERWDGSGYPRGLSGQNIPLSARIISIVDAYDVMTSDQIYRDRLTRSQAIEQLLQASGKQFDPELVKCFIDIISK